MLAVLDPSWIVKDIKEISGIGHGWCTAGSSIRVGGVDMDVINAIE
jgi:hypothetical protein